MTINRIIRGKIQRSIALLLLFTILNQIIWPNIAYALTAGPTSPEATNFEPIDTTDMINPSTGDFTYSLPLIEVPGPEGGYPLALSYHAAIQPNEEASWVGLGWSLNPGAIARNVNGYPDDWQNQNAITRTYWSGGKTSTLSIGVNAELPGHVASVGAGLAFSQDTYRGFGAGYSLNGHVGLNLPHSPFGIGVGASVGVSPYGDAYASLSLNASAGEKGPDGLKGSVGIGIATNGSVGFSGGISAGTASILGASISTSGGGTHVSVGGGSAMSVNNANAGKISTEASGWSFTTPTPVVSLSVGYKEVRYWSDESATVAVNGVLNNHSSINSISDMDHVADDNYQIPDITHKNFIDYPDPTTQAGGTYPDFDNYSVTAQGLSGYMRPYILNTALFNQNRINNNDHGNDVQAEALNGFPANYNSKWQFRFTNDFSNSYTQDSPYSTSSYSLQHYDFGSVAYGNNDGNYGYDASTNRLEGSKHIEYFTNDQIINGTAAARGFIDCQNSTGGFTRPSGSQIGGFMITNASGVTYHYALPAYESNEDIYTQRIDTTKGLAYNDLHKNASYAYTWYLTAITGPDYVSRGTLGTIDRSDWGYWVKFDYGKWADAYNWRNPSQGANVDLDNGFKTFTSGSKEVYYLDAIETRTHTALFEKEIRADAKSLTTLANKDAQDPGFYTIPQSACNYPTASLRLKSVFLIQNDHMPNDINAIRGYGNNINSVYTYGRSCNPSAKVHHGENIFDVNDNISYFTANCIKRIVFNHDYSLTPNTPNSFDPTGSSTYNNNPTMPGSYLGKLTLLSVDFQGKNAASLIPPIQFQYDLDTTQAANQGTIAISQSSADVPGTNQAGIISVSAPSQFNTGDILRFAVNGTNYYCLLKSTSDGGATYNVLFLNHAPPSSNTNLAAYKTKNPPYNKDSYDLWGCYKADYVASRNENLSRITTPLSNKATDVWSLRKINSSLGANITINYEGDTYNRSVLNHNRSLIINSITRNSAYNYTLNLNTEGLDLTTIYKPNDVISFLYAATYNGTDYVRNTDSTRTMPPSIRYGSPAPSPSAIANWYSAKPVVTAVTPNQVTVTVGSTDEENLYGYYHSNNYTAGQNFKTGNMIVNGSTLYSGGGLRVKEIVVDDLTGHINKTSYDYSLPAYTGAANSSSGVTAYEPLVFDADNTANANLSPSSQQTYRKELYKYHNQMLAIAREMPSPGVIYEYVKVQDASVLPSGQVVPIEGKTMYQYEIFRPEMIGLQVYNYSGKVTQNQNIQLNGNSYVNVGNSYKNNIAIKDYTSRIGNLRRVVTYDNLGNKLSEKINHYLHDDLNNTSFQNQIDTYEPRLAAYKNQGVFQERYGNARLVTAGLSPQTGEVAVYDDYYVMSNKETYPCIQTGTTQIDYKNGTKADQTNLAFDFYSGSVVKTLNSDSYGNRFISQVTPAYLASDGTNLAYPALGLKTHDDVSATQHKQMLTQQASAYTFSVDASNTPIGVITATAQTWSNAVPVLDPDGNPTSTGQANIWRPLSNLNWMAAGSSANNLTPIASFQDYFAPGGNSNASWKTTGTLTQYNVYSAATEGSDINGIFATTHMGYNSSRVLVTGATARYNEIAFCGAEDPLLSGSVFSGNISPGGGSIASDAGNSHTGVKSLLVPAGQNGFNYTITSPLAKSYSVMVWVKPTASNVAQASLYYQVNGGTVVQPTQTFAKTATGWYLLEMTIPASAVIANGNLVVGCKNGSSAELYFDDFRVQPTASSTTAYVYDLNSGELTYILNSNNLFVHYQYDAVGRLVKVYKEVLGKPATPLIKNIQYHYSRNTSGS